jgi:hypothetical protein
VKRLGGLVALTLLALAGCTSKPPAAAGPPPTTAATSPSATAGSPSATASATGTAGPTGSPGDVIEFSVDGAGPYALGNTLTALQGANLLDQVTPSTATCPQDSSAQGTGTWHDVQLWFHKDGTLYLLVNNSPAIPTPSGAWLGTKLADLKTIYKQIPGQDLSHGGKVAYLVVTLSGRGILFLLDPAAKTVTSMIAGDADYLKATFLTGANFC